MNLKLLSIALLATLSYGSHAEAALILDFSVSAKVGDVQTLSVFLQETSPTTTLSVDGLSVFTIGFDYGTSEGSVTSLQAASPFSDSGSSASNGVGKLSGFFSAGAKSPSLLLGTIDFTFNSDADADTTFVFRDFNASPTSADVISGSGVVLDDTIFTGGRTFQTTISATAVPEPASFALIGVAVAAVAARPRFKRGWGKKTPDTV